MTSAFCRTHQLFYYIIFYRKGEKQMLFSISVLLLLGMSLGALCKKLHLPALTGMLITGIFLGPYALDLIDASILSVSADLRRIALIIILIRAGLSLNLDDLKKVGRPAILMCFVPACFEMAGMILLAQNCLASHCLMQRFLALSLPLFPLLSSFRTW